MRTNPDGTIDVRVVLTVKVDPNAWARTMMDREPDETLQKEVRRDVKRRVRDKISSWGADLEIDEDNPVIGEVFAEGLYDVVRG